MLTRASVIYGTNAVRVAEFALPEIGPQEILLRVVSSSMCLSTYKALTLGSAHKRVPPDIEQTPVMTGHEFAGVVEQVGPGLTGQYVAGQSVAVQPAMGLPNGCSPGYSYPFYGGDATYCIVPQVAVEKGCVLPYEGSYYASASLAEPMSCIIGAFHASYHTRPLVAEHQMGIRPGGTLAVLGCGGPMGVGTLDYALHGPYRPRLVVDGHPRRRARRRAGCAARPADLPRREDPRLPAGRDGADRDRRAPPARRDGPALRAARGHRGTQRRHLVRGGGEVRAGHVHPPSPDSVSGSVTRNTVRPGSESTRRSPW